MYQVQRIRLAMLLLFPHIHLPTISVKIRSTADSCKTQCSPNVVLFMVQPFMIGPAHAWFCAVSVFTRVRYLLPRPAFPAQISNRAYIGGRQSPFREAPEVLLYRVELALLE